MKYLLAIFAAMAIAGIAAAGIWFSAHPCVREETQLCSYSECASWGVTIAGKAVVQTCWMWEERVAPCTVCVERKP